MWDLGHQCKCPIENLPAEMKSIEIINNVKAVGEFIFHGRLFGDVVAIKLAAADFLQQQVILF